MKMKLQNKQVPSVLNALFNLGNRCSIADKWELTKYSKPLVEAKNMIDAEVNAIIEKEGGENKSINIDNESYVTLMDLDVDIDMKPLTLSQLERYNPSMQELMSLEDIIEV